MPERCPTFARAGACGPRALTLFPPRLVSRRAATQLTIRLPRRLPAQRLSSDTHALRRPCARRPSPLCGRPAFEAGLLAREFVHSSEEFPRGGVDAASIPSQGQPPALLPVADACGRFGERTAARMLGPRSGERPPRKGGTRHRWPVSERRFTTSSGLELAARRRRRADSPSGVSPLLLALRHACCHAAFVPLPPRRHETTVCAEKYVRPEDECRGQHEMMMRLTAEARPTLPQALPRLNCSPKAVDPELRSSSPSSARRCRCPPASPPQKHPL